MRKIVTFLFLLFIPNLLKADNVTIHLKDGSKIQGNIIDSNEEEIKITTSFGLLTIPRSEIEEFDREERKNPDKATKLAIIPGVGQFYNDEHEKAGAVFLASLFGFVALYDISTGGLKDETLNLEISDIRFNIFKSNLSTIGLAIGGVGIYAWSFFDAHKTAKRINRKRGYTLLPGDSGILNFSHGRIAPQIPIIQIVSIDSKKTKITVPVIEASFY